MGIFPYIRSLRWPLFTIKSSHHSFLQDAVVAEPPWSRPCPVDWSSSTTGAPWGCPALHLSRKCVRATPHLSRTLWRPPRYREPSSPSSWAKRTLDKDPHAPRIILRWKSHAVVPRRARKQSSGESPMVPPCQTCEPLPPTASSPWATRSWMDDPD
jgi:hypothetical protein